MSSSFTPRTVGGLEGAFLSQYSWETQNQLINSVRRGETQRDQLLRMHLLSFFGFVISKLSFLLGILVSSKENQQVQEVIAPSTRPCEYSSSGEEDGFLNEPISYK